MEQKPTKKILFVDDDKNLLSSLKRLFKDDPVATVFTLESAEEGLEFLQKEIVDLVATDQWMPKMKGYEFLLKVKELYPDILRILFTGHADLETVISSINSGEVYRFLTKPWNDEDLKITLYKALEYKELVIRNKQLNTQIKKQNEELTVLNSELEQKVKKRTEQLEKTLHLVKEMADTVQKNFHGLVLMYADLMSLSNAFLGAHSKRVAELCLSLSEKLKLDKENREILFYSALLHDIGMIGFKENIVNKSQDTFTSEEVDIFHQHPVVGEKLVSAVHNLKKISLIIRSHHEEYSGGGFPDNLSGKEIPFGARIVHIANDYDSLIFKGGNTPEKALQILEERSSLHYDPEILNYFTEVIKDRFKTKEGKTQSIRLGDLKPGMYLLEDVILKNGLLLFPKGVILTSAMIDKLGSFSGLLDLERTVEAVF